MSVLSSSAFVCSFTATIKGGFFCWFPPAAVFRCSPIHPHFRESSPVFHLFSSNREAARLRRMGGVDVAAVVSSVEVSSDNANKAGKHSQVGHKSVLKSDKLYQYILDTSVYPREPAPLKGLREMTAHHPWNLMTTSPDEGQFLMFLLKMMNAKKTMEIGVYTGYSLLSTALALPEDGTVLAMDINRKNFELGYPYMVEAGVAHKIDFREGPALAALDEMLKDEANHGAFDFIFVDADKDNYLNYHKRLISLVKVGGVIGYDNTLWNGSVVAEEDEPMPKYVKYYKDFVIEVNKALAADSRIEITQVPISDGITLCRRLN